MYDPSHQDKKNWLRSVMDYAPEAPLTCPLNMKIIFKFKRPKSHYGTGRNKKIMKNKAPVYMTKTPDIDNLIKFYLDAMNGIFFEDDRQIIRIESEKLYINDVESLSTGGVDIQLFNAEYIIPEGGTDYIIPDMQDIGQI